MRGCFQGARMSHQNICVHFHPDTIVDDDCMGSHQSGQPRTNSTGHWMQKYVVGLDSVSHDSQSCRFKMLNLLNLFDFPLLQFSNPFSTTHTPCTEHQTQQDQATTVASNNTKCIRSQQTRGREVNPALLINDAQRQGNGRY